jgi:glycosyltransferase involved in cell wall biosynthesis
MKIRFLLHNVFDKGGGVLTVSLGLAACLAATEDVEIISVFGGGREPVRPLPQDLPLRVLIDTTRLRSGAEAAPPGLDEPSQVVPRREPRYSSYSRFSDAVLADYLGSLRDGALVTMQPGISIAAARFGTSDYVRVAQDHRPFVGRPVSIRKAYAEHASGFDAFLSLTAGDQALYQELLGDRTRVERMPNGTPPYLGPSSTLDSKLAVAAGRLEPSKGFDLLIDAWGSVAEQHADWQLHIYGEGSQEGALSARIRDLGLEDRVHLKGYSNEMQARMSESSLFVLSSRAEGYPMVLLEAMACGVPVVSTNCSFGPAEIITEGVDGFLAENGNREQLAEGILRMVRLSPQQRLAMGHAARAKSRERSYAAVAERWRTLIDECETERRRRQRANRSRFLWRPKR